MGERGAAGDPSARLSRDIGGPHTCLALGSAEPAVWVQTLCQEQGVGCQCGVLVQVRGLLLGVGRWGGVLVWDAGCGCGVWCWCGVRVWGLVLVRCAVRCWCGGRCWCGRRLLRRLAERIQQGARALRSRRGFRCSPAPGSAGPGTHPDLALTLI